MFEIKFVRESLEVKIKAMIPFTYSEGVNVSNQDFSCVNCIKIHNRLEVAAI